MNDTKWLAIMVIGFALAIFGALAIDSMAKSNCRIEGFAQHTPADQIERICK
jgi:hypothetical protein